MKLETILSPAELPALAARDLSKTICVVFDILRATSTFITALQNGAREIIPLAEISEAVALRRAQPEILLAGERDGLKISAAQSGGIDFDFGNSPREFTTEKVRGKIIASTTTNGTRALRSCSGAKMILASSFLNLSATSDFLRAQSPANILLICAGTGANEATEDILAAGALANSLDAKNSRATEIAIKTFHEAKSNLAAAMADSQNGRRLLTIPDLRADVEFCSRQNIFNLVAAINSAGALQKLSSAF